jgi:drug/metabolite transporter (DMT)-like permease
VAASWQLVMATVLLAPVAVFTSLREGVHPTPTRVAAIVLLGALGTGVAYVLSYRLIADVGPTRASLVTYLIPIVAVAVGVAFLDEAFSFRLVVGGGLTVAGIALLNVGGRVPVRTRV